MNLIYVRESDIPITKHRKTLIKQLLKQQGVVTYSDKECTKIQCEKVSQNGHQTFRSISDLHAIVRSRFKLTSLESLMKILKEITNEEKCIGIVWCKQIEKVVVKYMPNTPGNYITSYSKDNYYTTKGVDGYSLKDYEKILNKL